jgi:dipeptidyl aminopeptidase/acylaminoacyl peptidase
MLRSLGRPVIAAVILTLASCGEQPPAGGKVSNELVPFNTYFKPAEADAPLLSPDGKWISYIARFQDAYNVFVAPVDNFGAGKPLTKESGRGIQWYTVSGAINYRWTPDSRYIVYLKDNNGDEHYRIYSAAVESGEIRELTPGENVQAHVIALSRTRPTTILAAVNASAVDENLSLLYGSNIVEIDVATGAQKMILEKIPYASVVADNDLKIRLVGTLTPAYGYAFLKMKPDGTTEPFYEVTFDDMGGLAATGETQMSRVSADNKRVTILDNVGRDTTAIVSIDLETGEKTVIASDDRVDIRDVLYDPATNDVVSYGTVWTRLEWQPIDQRVDADIKFLEGFKDGDLRINSRSADGRHWLVGYMVSDEPTSFYHYDSASKAMTRLFSTTPDLEKLKLAKMHAYAIKSRDGLDLVGYYTLPIAADPEQDGKPTSPVPMVVLIHGGPGDERAIYAYAPFVQWLANRGYGLLYVNFRGSAGFGKKYRNAAQLEWGGKMHDDVLDQVDHAIKQGWLDPKKVGVMGGSYGGYATLVAMTKTPDTFACGVDLVGPSDLSIKLPHFNEEWMARTIGDPRTPEGIAFLRSRSPFYLADKIKNPLLIGQGDKDSRVPTAQSDMMVDAMKKAGGKVVYLLYPDEGHGLLRPENTSSFWSVTEVFLSQCLGGRSEPLTPAQFKGSSVVVKEGMDYIPGLKQALESGQASQ